MKVFLTGGTGFIGSHILMKLLKNDHKVTVLADITEHLKYYQANF